MIDSDSENMLLTAPTAQSIEEQIKAFNKKYKGLKGLQNNELLIKISNSIVGLCFIHCVCWVVALKIFKEQHSLSISRFVEITALITSSVGLLLALNSLFYIKKKKAELYIESEKIIEKLEAELEAERAIKKSILAKKELNEGQQADDLEKNLVNQDSEQETESAEGEGSKQPAPESLNPPTASGNNAGLDRTLSSSSEGGSADTELTDNNSLLVNQPSPKTDSKAVLLREIALKEELERLKRIHQSLERNNSKERLASYLGLGASSIFVMMEILAVAQLYKNFGMDKWHGSFPTNFQGIVDSVAIALLVSASFLALSSALDKEKAKNKTGAPAETGAEEKDKKGGEGWYQNPAIILPLIGCGAALLNLLGKILQGMEAAKTFNIPLGEGSNLAVGFTIRIVACLLGLGTLIYTLKETMDKSIDSDLKIEALRHTESYIQPEV